MEHVLPDLVGSMKDGAVLIENRWVPRANKNTRIQTQRVGIGGELFRETVGAIKEGNNN